MAEDRLTSMQADVLRAYRRAKGYSQEYVATLLGVSRQTYVAVEQGQAPVGNDDRRLLARSLGIPPSMLGVSGGAVIPLPATDLVRALWAQFYSGTRPSMRSAGATARRGHTARTAESCRNSTRL